MWLARRLPTHPAVAAVLATGEINVEHAQVIIGCLVKLDPQWREAAQAELVEFARDHDPATLAALCRELRVRSGADDDAEAAAQRRYDSRWATVSKTFEGMIRFEGMLDPESGGILQAALTPLMVRAGQIDERPPEQRRADALTELARFSLHHASSPTTVASAHRSS